MFREEFDRHADPMRTAVQLNKYVAAAPFKDPEQSAFINVMKNLSVDCDCCAREIQSPSAIFSAS